MRANFVNENMDNLEPIVVEMDTAVDVRNGKIDPYGSNDERVFLNFLKRHNIEYEVINPKGPGGGWPIIKYIGLRKDIVKMLKSQFEADDEDIEFYLEGN